jgi:hypothetical protein
LKEVLSGKILWGLDNHLPFFKFKI